MVTKYQTSYMMFHEMNGKVTVPKYQRRLVWSKSEKESFIKTLHNGYPFGSVLLYKYTSDSKDKFSIIDGLQRFTTIQDFKNNPEKYISFKDFAEEIFEKLSIPSTTPQSYQNMIKELEMIIRDVISTKELSDASVLISKISDKYSKLVQIDSNIMMGLIRIHTNIQNYVKDYLDVDNINIPYILFNGDESELAEVFENLNRGGKKLSKYQVFSAQWSSTFIKLGNCKYSRYVMDSIISRYNDLNEQRRIEIEDFDEIALRKSNQFTLAEFCYVLGKHILTTMDVFWGEKRYSEDLANELGYSYFAAILKIDNTKLSEIIKYKNELSQDDGFVFLSDLFSKTSEIFTVINNEFKKWLTIPSSGDDYRYEGNAATNFQILSYALELWNSKYLLKINDRRIIEKQGFRTTFNLIRENIIYQYIYDCVSNYWAGTGDRKLDDVAIHSKARLLKKVEQNIFEIVLLQWNDERLSNSSINFDSISRMLITILMNIQKYEGKERSYDYEHVIPKARFKEKYKQFKIAGGSLGNIMILSEKHNRGKKNLTLYEDLHELQIMDKTELDKSFYPSMEVLASVMNEIDSSTNNSFKITHEFLQYRSKEIINFIVHELYKNK